MPSNPLVTAVPFVLHGAPHKNLLGLRRSPVFFWAVRL